MRSLQPHQGARSRLNELSLLPIAPDLFAVNKQTGKRHSCRGAAQEDAREGKSQTAPSVQEERR